MHIALYTHSRLPVEGYGGTQRVVVWLARGLVELGHRVTLLAPAGSRVPGAEMVPLDPREIARPGFDLTPLLPASVEILHAHGPLRAHSRSPTRVHAPRQLRSRTRTAPEHHLRQRRSRAPARRHRLRV